MLESNVGVEIRFRKAQLIEIVARGSLALILLALGAGPAHAGSCLVDSKDASRLDQAGAFTLLTSNKTAIRPCQGRVTGPEMLVMFSRGNGLTQIALVPSGRDLRDNIKEPLIDFAEPGTIFGSLWKSLSGVKPSRPSSKKFDDAEGVTLGGQVLEGEDLRLPLERLGWGSVEAVLLQAKGQSPKALRVEDGWLHLPVASLALGKYQLVQGKRVAAFEVTSAKDFDGLSDGLKDIRSGSPTADIRAFRETFLFWEQGLRMNAVAIDAIR